MNTVDFSDRQIRDAVGLVCESRSVFIKQYGEMRTGTNVVRALLMQNFKNIFVLMHILGDKHSVPVDLKRLHQELNSYPDAPWRFTFYSTYDKRSATSFKEDYRQLRFLRALCDPIYSAFCERRLFYLISVKHPYQWAKSMLRYWGWSLSKCGDGSWEEKCAIDLLSGACTEFNKKYQVWLRIHNEQARAVSIIVRNENLADDWKMVLETCEQKMKLERIGNEFRPVDGIVLPTWWDYSKSRSTDDWLNCTHRSPDVHLPKSLHDVVTRTIDWSLMKELGYEPERFD